MEKHSKEWDAISTMMTKDERRQRFDRRKAKHVRDIRHKDYIGNERNTCKNGKGYNVVNGADIEPISNGGGWVSGNPRFNRQADVPLID